MPTLNFIGGPKDGYEHFTNTVKEGSRFIFAMRYDVDRDIDQKSGFYVSGLYDGTAPTLDVPWIPSKKREKA